MRVAHIVIYPMMGMNNRVWLGVSTPVNDVVTWSYAGWYADLRLEQVSGPEFSRIENEVARSYSNLRFRDDKKNYSFADEATFVEFRSQDLIQSYVARGALTNPNVAYELAKHLETLIRGIIQAG